MSTSKIRHFLNKKNTNKDVPVQKGHSASNGYLQHFSAPSTSRPSDTLETDSVPVGCEEAQNRQNQFLENSGKGLQGLLCKKNPGHKDFVPAKFFSSTDLPVPYNDQDWATFIREKRNETVKLCVRYTSRERSDDLGFTEFMGTNKLRTGSGTVFLLGMGEEEPCSLTDCTERPGQHRVSGCFKVVTAAHVVCNDEEAKYTDVEFFYDDEDRRGVVKAKGIRVSFVDTDRNMAVVECRTHDLNLYKVLEESRRKRDHLIEAVLKYKVSQEPIVVLISHPHGQAKHISIGKLRDLKTEGERRRTPEGVDLIGCILTYTTPTCAGAGGGTINLIGGGEVCLAFAPHCASKADGDNLSGLGWTRYPLKWNPNATNTDNRFSNSSVSSSSPTSSASSYLSC